MAVKVIYDPTKGLYQEHGPEAGVDLSGPVGVDVISLANVTVSDDYTVGPVSVIFVDASVDDVTLTMPSARFSRGHVFHMKKIDSTGNFLIIVGVDGETIDGSANQQINTQNTIVSVTSNGTNWFIL